MQEENSPSGLVRHLATRPRLQRYVKFLVSFHAIALAIAAIAILGFVKLASEVAEKEIDQLNRSISHAIYAARTPFLTDLALQITALGSVVVVSLIAIMFVIILLGQGKERTAISFAVLIGGASILIFLLKWLFAVARPSDMPLVKEGGYSFPSGHSVISFTLYGGMGVWLVLAERGEKWRWLLAGILFFLAAGIALSRVYLGVHWPSDVLAGLLIASCWVSLCLVVERYLTRPKTKAELGT